MTGAATLHATCVAIAGRGVLLTGASGSGKSDLALRLIDRGAELVADDRVVVDAVGDAAIASCPPTIAGRIEARGLGILAMPCRDRVALALHVALDGAVPRMPDDPPATFDAGGVALPSLALAPFEASAAFKIEQALILYGLAP